MKFLITPYVIICGLTSIFAMIVILMTWKKRNDRSGRLLFFMMIAIFIWAGGVTVEYGSPTLPAKIIWSKLQYIGVLSCPVLFFLLAIEFSPYRSVINRQFVQRIFIVPLLTYVLTVTNEWHHLIWTGNSSISAENNLAEYYHGVVFWISVVGYSYILMLLGTILLLWTVHKSPSAFLYQPLILIISAMLPWVGNIIYLCGLSPLPGLEITPLLLVLTGALLTWNLFRTHLHDLVPVARVTLIETMPDGMLVMDEHQRVIDFNPSARSLLQPAVTITVGMYASDVFRGCEEISPIQANHARLYDQRQTITVEYCQNFYLELSFSPIHIPHRGFDGTLIFIRDISLRKMIEDEISFANDRLREQLDEIEALQKSLQEQAVRDSLTGLFNRRYLDETLEREFARSLRNKNPISISMLDIDHFKSFNDSHGHMAGDVMLQHLGQLLSQQTRLGDIACRYGGEEFVIVIPNIHQEEAYRRVEQLRMLFQQTPVVFENTPYFSTFSAGVAAFPQHGVSAHDVLSAADQALYSAKSSGRNCVKLAPYGPAAR